MQSDWIVRMYVPLIQIHPYREREGAKLAQASHTHTHPTQKKSLDITLVGGLNIFFTQIDCYLFLLVFNIKEW